MLAIFPILSSEDEIFLDIQFFGFSNFLIMTSLPNEPGALAGMATKLSDAGVNIKSFYIMKMELDVADVAMTTDNPSKTKELLGI